MRGSRFGNTRNGPAVLAVVRVAILGGQELNRYGLRAALEQTPGVDVIGDAAMGGTAALLVQHKAPDVVLLDTVEPCRRTCASIRQILDWRACAAVMVVAAELCDCSHEVLRSGARGL